MGTYRNTKQVRYKNKVYSSVSGLCRETCLHRSKIYRMIDRGEIVYVNRTTNRTTEPNRTTELTPEQVLSMAPEELYELKKLQEK